MGQGVAVVHPLAAPRQFLAVGQFQQFGKKPPFQFAGDVGGEDQIAASKRRGGAVPAGFATERGPAAGGQLRQRQQHVGRRAGDVPTQGVAMQGQAAAEGEIFVNEGGDGGAAARHIAFDAVMHRPPHDRPVDQHLSPDHLAAVLGVGGVGGVGGAGGVDGLIGWGVSPVGRRLAVGWVVG